MFTKYLFKLRIFLLKKLIGVDLKVISNITVTSDIIEYNHGVDILYNTHVKQVSRRQSFVLDPTTTRQVW